MKNHRFFFCLLCICFLFHSARANPYRMDTDRFFDSPEIDSETVVVAALYPSMGTIYNLMALREQGFLPAKNVIVVGVFHSKEKTDYKQSIAFIQRAAVDWFKFHRIEDDIDKESLFRENGCTADFKKIFDKSHGILFFGGADIPAELYHEKTGLLTSIETPYRHYLELSFIFHLLGGYQNKDFDGLLTSEPDYPVMGFCLGCQSLNVGTGGTLIQDIWSEVYGKQFFEDIIEMDRECWHSNPWYHLNPAGNFVTNNMHRIRMMEEGVFVSIFGFSKDDRPYVHSGHHQALKKLGKGIKVTATSLDGKVIEAIEHERFPHVLGVQFHPEYRALWNSESRIRITPKDNEWKSRRSILEENPPSYAFHEKIWSWFSENVSEYHHAHR